MLNFLCDVAGEISQYGDLLTSKWAEILGWISIPTIGTALLAGIIKIIITCINKKISTKSMKPLTDQVKEVKTTVLGEVEGIKKTFEANLSDYSAVIEGKITSAIKTYEENKIKAYNSIINADTELKKVVGEIEETTNKIENVVEGLVKNKEEVKEIVSANVDDAVIDSVKEIKNAIVEEEIDIDDLLSR